jgi:hypothetical protein
MNTETETLTEEFEQILSSKVDTKLEEAGYTKNVEEWIKFIENSKTDPLAPNEYICDYTIVKNAKAFALGPVFSYMGKACATESKVFKSLNELKEFLKNKNYILYVVHRLVVSFVQEDLTPDISKASEIRYTFRGHILNDT